MPFAGVQLCFALANQNGLLSRAVQAVGNSFTSSGMVILSRDVQPANAPYPIVVKSLIEILDILTEDFLICHSIVGKCGKFLYVNPICFYCVWR